MGGWFIVNVADAPAFKSENAGTYVPFEKPGDRFPDFGINIHVLEPGEPNCKYHWESPQEAFLVLHGECIAIIEGEEHAMRQWDFLHCPPDTLHFLVGAGDRRSWVLMVGGRVNDGRVRFPVSEEAARHGASVKRETTDAADAWAQVGWSLEDLEPAPFPWPPD